MSAPARRGWFVFASVLGIVVAAGLVTASFRGGGSATPPSTTTTPAPSTTAATTTTLEPLPVPEDSPADPYANVPVVQIGSIEIPRIGLDHPVYEGITLTVIDHGPGHWPGSALPCHRGNAVFPGHRVTHSHPFLNIDQLEPGDEIIFHMPEADCVYRVTETLIVVPTDMWVVDQTETPTATIIACHPKHSAAQRIVVKSEFVQEVPKPA